MAKKMMDIGLDVNGDLKAVNGDWAVVESTGVHQKYLLLAVKGDFKYAPLVGVGLATFRDDEGAQAVVAEIIRQFKMDGMEVQQLNPNPVNVKDSSVNLLTGAWYK